MSIQQDLQFVKKNVGAVDLKDLVIDLDEISPQKKDGVQMATHYVYVGFIGF